MNLVALDVEAVNATVGPLWSIAAVRIRGFVPCTAAEHQSFYQRKQERPSVNAPELFQWIVDFGSAGPPFLDGNDFWTLHMGASHFMQKHVERAPAKTIAVRFRQFLNSCYASGYLIAVGNVHTDFSLLNAFLHLHQCDPLQFDHKGEYQHDVYVVTDMMRASYAWLDSKFNNLSTPDLQLSIKKEWQRRFGSALLLTFPAKEKTAIFKQFGPKEFRHLAIWDSWTLMEIFLMMEDLQRDEKHRIFEAKKLLDAAMAILKQTQPMMDDASQVALPLPLASKEYEIRSSSSAQEKQAEHPLIQQPQQLWFLPPSVARPQYYLTPVSLTPATMAPSPAAAMAGSAMASAAATPSPGLVFPRADRIQANPGQLSLLRDGAAESSPSSATPTPIPRYAISQLGPLPGKFHPRRSASVLYAQDIRNQSRPQTEEKDA